jgi:hypothetical protein
MDKIKKYFSKNEQDKIKLYDHKKGITLEKYDILYVEDKLSFDEIFELLSKETAKVIFKMAKVDYEKLVDIVNEHKYKYIDSYSIDGYFLVYIAK